MQGNLVIVESPSKAKKIQEILGKDFIVKSSYGHIRDLQDNALSINIKDGFKPEYVIPADKKKIVAELQNAASKAETIWLASDADREGEAISWHLFETLGLKKENTRRIAFLEITPDAIKEAVLNPRDIDLDLVNAQQARRVLDRLVGFELSPVLWKKIQPKLSAGRVQSVALRLVVDREREINAFENSAYYKVDGKFIPEGCTAEIKACLNEKFKTAAQAEKFLEQCIGASYRVSGIDSKEGLRHPAPPFTTAELQQEASRKLGFSVSQTMQVAQRLYENGFITYMRTDSVNLSQLAIGSAKKYICEHYGESYSSPRRYKTKDKGAQEAHEAIRPTYIQNETIKGTAQEQKLYSLIWKRTVASQMTDAKVLNTVIEIESDKTVSKFVSETAKVLFDGFLKVYIEGSDDETAAVEEVSIPDIKTGQAMKENGISAECKFTQAPQRYTEASLVKKLKELRIGRPSTYAPTITTLTKSRGYIVKGDKEGHVEEVVNFTLKNGKISSVKKKEKVGADKSKLLPQDIGIMVSDFLVEHFPDIVDNGFTADVEENFDKVAEGKMQWDKLISDFYSPFHDNVQTTIKESDYSRLEREIGMDPADGQLIIARFGQYGPFVQKGEGENKNCVSLAKGQTIESLTLEEAVKLFCLPRTLGEKDGETVSVHKGPYGPYVKFKGGNVSIPRSVDPLSITLKEALELIDRNAHKKELKIIAQWGDIQLIDGNFGPYLKCKGSNFKLPKGTNAALLSEAEARKIVEEGTPTSHGHKFTKRKK